MAGCCRARFISLTGQLGAVDGGRIWPIGWRDLVTCLTDLIREVARRVATQSTGPDLWPVAGWVLAEGTQGEGGELQTQLQLGGLHSPTPQSWPSLLQRRTHTRNPSFGLIHSKVDEGQGRNNVSYNTQLARVSL